MIMRVHDRMSSHPVTIDPETSILVALNMMQYHRLRHLPVVDADGHVVGIVAERDLLLSTSRHLHTHLEVAEVMAHDVVTVEPQTLMGNAAMLMARHHFGSLPVVNEEGKLVGILTESDIFRAFADVMSAQKS